MIQLIYPADAVRVARLFHAASKDATKPTLSGLCFDPLGAKRLACVATDGFLMAWTVLEASEPHGLTDPLVLPAKGFQALKKAAKHKLKPHLMLDPEDKTFRLVTAKDGTLLFPPIQGDYPQWRKVIPSSASDLLPLSSLNLSAGMAWQAAEIMADPNLYNDGPERQYLGRLGARIGFNGSASSTLLFSKEGVHVLAMESRFAVGAPGVDLEALRKALTIPTLTREVP